MTWRDWMKMSLLLSAEHPRHLLLLSRGILESGEILRIFKDSQRILRFSVAQKTEFLDAAHMSDRRIL